MTIVNFAHIFSLTGLLLASVIGGFAHAAEGNIVCETAYGEKSFHIEDDRVVFSKETANSGRSISSIDMVRTEKRHHGFDKILNMNGNKHRIHIENPAEFSDVHDYMVITSPKGHEMTYPLSCRRS